MTLPAGISPNHASHILCSLATSGSPQALRITSALVCREPLRFSCTKATLHQFFTVVALNHVLCQNGPLYFEDPDQLLSSDLTSEIQDWIYACQEIPVKTVLQPGIKIPEVLGHVLQRATFHIDALDALKALENIKFGKRSGHFLLERTLQHMHLRETQVLAAFLDTDNYTFTQQEYYALKGRIESYQQMSSLQEKSHNMLQFLHMPALREYDLQTLKLELGREIQLMIEAGENALFAYAEFIAHYKRRIFQRVRHKIRRITRAMDHITADISSAAERLAPHS